MRHRVLVLLPLLALAAQAGDLAESMLKRAEKLMAGLEGERTILQRFANRDERGCARAFADALDFYVPGVWVNDRVRAHLAALDR